MLLAPPNQHTQCIEPHTYIHSQGAHHWLCSLAQALCPVRLILSCRHTDRCVLAERETVNRIALPRCLLLGAKGQDPLQLLVPFPDIPATLSHLRGHTLLHFLRGLKGQSWCPLKDAQQGQEQPHFLPADLRIRARLPTDHLPKTEGDWGGGEELRSWSCAGPILCFADEDPETGSSQQAHPNSTRQKLKPTLLGRATASLKEVLQGMCGLPAALDPTVTWHAFTEREVSGFFSWKEAEMVTYPLHIIYFSAE